MNIQKMLSDARKLGLPESDISRITTLSEKYNRAQTQLSDKPTTEYRGKDRTSKAISISELRQEKTETNDNIQKSKKSIKAFLKEKSHAFWNIVSRKDRKKAMKDADNKVAAEKEKIEKYKMTNKDIDKTIESLSEKLRPEMSQAEADLQAIATSIQTQLATKKQLTKLTKMMNNIDLHDTKYNPLIAFFNANANRTPSLDNPLPEVPAEVQALINEYNIERAEKVIRLTTDVAIRTYTAGNEMTRNFLRAARDSVLRGAQSQNRLLTAGNER